MSEGNGEPLPIDPTEHGIIRGAVSKLHTSLSAFIKEMPDGRNLVDIDPAHVLNSLSTITYDANDEIIALRHQGKSFDEATKSTTVTLDTLAHLIDTKIEYIIEPICPRGTLTLIQGIPKAGKSTFSLWLALCASIGIWPGEIFKIRKSVKVLFIEFEDSPMLVVKRAAAYLAGAGWDGYALPENFSLCDSPELWLDNPKFEQLLTDEIKTKEYEFVVIDTLSYVHQAEDENSSADMKVLMAALKRIVKATNCSAALLHHTGKSAADKPVALKGRGSSAISAAPDVILDWGDRKGTDVTPVKIISKYDDGLDLIVEYKRSLEGVQWVLSHTDESKQNKGGKMEVIFKTVQTAQVSNPQGINGSAIVSICGELGLGRTIVYEYLALLVEAKRLTTIQSGRSTLYSVVSV